MAMAALRREGRRFATPLLSPHRPVVNPGAVPSSFALSSHEEELLPLGVRFISTQVVRNRMKSIRNIQKITKAMKMVAASKLRKIQPRTENSRGLWQPFTALLGDMPNVDVKKNVVITVASDKGLCGGINSNVVKLARVLYQMGSGPEKVSRYVILGDKAKAQLARKSKDDIELSISELQMVPLNYSQISVLADDILKNVEYDALRVVFNKFKSIVLSMPTVATILSPEVVEKESESGGKLGELDSYEVEGGDSKSEILQNLTEFQFSCVSTNCCMAELERLILVELLVECLHPDVLFNAVLENACSEQGSRMSAMDSSSRNAGDMLQRLTLNYNKTRQAAITTDLIEIISGKAALEANW